jgi:hypothetical protein
VDVWLERRFDSELSLAVAGFASTGVSRSEFRVFNLGVAGYSSIQGLRLLKTRVLDLNPDVVVVGFAMNEPHMAGVDDKHASAGEESINLVQTLSGTLNKSESFKLLRYWALLLRWKPRSISEYLEDKSYNATWRQQVTGNDFDKFELWTRDSLRDYDHYHREMIKVARNRNISIVLLYNEFWRESLTLRCYKEFRGTSTSRSWIAVL